MAIEVNYKLYEKYMFIYKQKCITNYYDIIIMCIFIKY